MIEREIQIKYNELIHEELSDIDKQLVERAIKAAKLAYAPYSKFRVGASILLDNNNIVVGNNQENAAYPSGLCAERVALFYANANYSENSVKTIAIVVIDDKGLPTNQSVSPCGACRQVILESETRYNDKIKILLVAKSKVIEFKSIKDLLPLSFTQDHLLLP